LKATKTERFSLALAFGSDLQELRNTVKVVQAIYNANYQFATPPPTPTVQAEVGDHSVQLSWDDVAERSTDPVALVNDFEGYRIYRSTDPDFLDPQVILSGRGTTPIGHGKTVAQFDLVDGIWGYSEVTVEGIAYYLGNESGLVHTWKDTAVTNGQQYYYAVTSYDYGPTVVQSGGGFQKFTFYPSENSISVSRTLRGGTILPKNVVAVRPNPKVLGYTHAGVSDATHIAGDGVGSVSVKRINSTLIPNEHVFTVTFSTDPDSVHAQAYILTDSTHGKVIFASGNVFDGSLRGQVGSGLQPVVYTLPTIEIDSSTGFTTSSTTNAKLSTEYVEIMPIGYKRFAFPVDLTVEFSNTIVDTSLAQFPFRALPVKFRVIAHTPTGDKRLKFFFGDLNRDSTLSYVPGGNHEAIQVLTGPDSVQVSKRITWKIQLTGDSANTKTPTLGDVYEMRLNKPFTVGDTFRFTTVGESVAADQEKEAFPGAPYVVPNPYVGAASFEPAPFGVQGRGDRRIEFRGLPRSCSIRIYTIRGELVQTLYHDGSNDGYVAWNLRTKDNLDVAPGLYIYHVDAGSDGTHIGKFGIIK
jgi:hypothetical protein